MHTHTHTVTQLFLIGCLFSVLLIPRALSLRNILNMVSEYEMEGGSFRMVKKRTHQREVTPTGCPPDPAGWLTSGGSLVVSGRFSQVRLSRTPVWCLSGACSTQEADGNVAETLIECCSTRERVTTRIVG